MHRPHSAFFFFYATATTEIYTLSLHDALPICSAITGGREPHDPGVTDCRAILGAPRDDLVRKVHRLLGDPLDRYADRKSTRLNSSHGYISYAVFCLKKKKKKQTTASNI